MTNFYFYEMTIGSMCEEKFTLKICIYETDIIMFWIEVENDEFVSLTLFCNKISLFCSTEEKNF